MFAFISDVLSVCAALSALFLSYIQLKNLRKRASKQSSPEGDQAECKQRS